MKKRICAAALAGVLLSGQAALAADAMPIPDWLNVNGSQNVTTAPTLPVTQTPSAGQYPPGTVWNPDGTPTYPAGTVWNADGTLTGPDGLIYTPYDTVQPVMTAAEATAYLRAQDPELAAASLLTYAEIEDLVRDNNLTVQANRETMKGIEAVDLDDAIDDLEDMIDDLEDAADGLEDLSDEILDSMEDMKDAVEELGGLTDGELRRTPVEILTDFGEALMRYQTTVGMGTVASLQGQIGTLKAQIAQLEAQIETLENTDYERYERQFENIEDQIVMGAQTAYIGLATLQQNYVCLLQQSDLANVKVTEMQARYKLGQISDLNVAEAEQGKLTVDSAIETLEFNLRNTKGDLNLLLGREASENFILDALPPVTTTDLGAMVLEDDLAAGKKHSYDIYAAENAVEDAEDLDKKDDGRKNKIRAAEYNLDAAERSFEQTFRKLFRSVADKNRLVTVAVQAQGLEARKLAAEQLKFDRGMISRNDLLEAEINKAKADSDVKLAEIELFSAYMKYEWAARGVVMSGGMA